MSSTSIKKLLYILIFPLLIYFSMLFGTAANGSVTHHVPEGDTTYGGGVQLSWPPPQNIPLNDVSTSYRLSPDNGSVTLDHDHRTDDDGITRWQLTFHENACGTYTVTMWVHHLPWVTYQARIVYWKSCPGGTTSSSSSGTTEPTKLFIVSGYDQTGIVGQPLAEPFVVRVRDREQDNKPLEGVKVTFTVLTGGGSLSTTTTITDIRGLAKSTLTLGDEPGTNTVEVRAEGVSKEVVFSAEATLPPPVPTRLSIISGDNQTGLTGEPLANPFIVEVRDQHGDPISGATVTLAVTGGDGSLSATTAITDQDGQAQTTLTLGTEPGVNTVEVNIEGISQTAIFSAEATLPPSVPTRLLSISGNNQTGLTGEPLPNPFVVEVRDQRGDPLQDVLVTFTIVADDGSTTTTTAMTDEDGHAEITLPPGTDPGTYTITVSVEGITETVTFTVVVPHEFDLSLSPGFNLIHLPLKVRAVQGMPMTIQSVSDLYDVLGGADTVHWLTTHDSQTQTWYGYFGDADRGTTADRGLTDQTGILANMRVPVSVHLGGDALGTAGSSTITLSQGSNLVGLPLEDARINRVSDLFTLDGLGGNVLAVIVTDGEEFKLVGRAGDPGDIPVRDGQGFIIIVERAAQVSISGGG